MPNKDGSKIAVVLPPLAEAAPLTTSRAHAAPATKTAATIIKEQVADVPPPEELLGSLTRYNGAADGEPAGPAVRTSARVIKKMRLDSSEPEPRREGFKPDTEKAENGIASSGISSKLISKDGSKGTPNTAKQRMPKALWSATEKNLFFEGINEYGKDFDAITAYICNKMRRKGIPDATMKTKHQVSHFYYRTWHKVSKHIKFSDNVKKVVQELYALINYGEMRKRLVSGVASRVAARLPELVRRGAVAVRARGRTLRVRTPMCRALRRLNGLEEWDEQLRLPGRVCVVVVARNAEAWARVQSSAHNPRLLAPALPSLRLSSLLLLLQRRWREPLQAARDDFLGYDKNNPLHALDTLDQQINYLLNTNNPPNFTPDVETALTSLNFNSQELPKYGASNDRIADIIAARKEAKMAVNQPRITSHQLSPDENAHKINLKTIISSHGKDKECFDDADIVANVPNAEIGVLDEVHTKESIIKHILNTSPDENAQKVFSKTMINSVNKDMVCSDDMEVVSSAIAETINIDDALMQILNTEDTNFKTTETIKAEKSVKESKRTVETEIKNVKDISKSEIKEVLKVSETGKAVESETEMSVRRWQVRYGCRGMELHVGPKPGSGINLPVISVSEHVTSQRICLAAYQERLGANSTGDSTGLQNGVGLKGRGGRFKNQKRQRKDSGENEISSKKNKQDTENCDKNDIFDIDETANDGMDMCVTFSDIKNSINDTDNLVVPVEEKSNDDKYFPDKDKDFFSEVEDDDKYNNETDGENEPVKTIQLDDKGSKNSKFKSKLRVRSKKEREVSPPVVPDSPEDLARSVAPGTSGFLRKSWDRNLVMQQARRGWSTHDAGDLTIGDLYLMFGSESKLELNYWWAEPSTPLSSAVLQQLKQVKDLSDVTSQISVETKEPSLNNNNDEEAKEKVTDVERLLLSPALPSVELCEQDLKKDMSPDNKNIPHVPDNPSSNTAFHLASKIINNPYSESLTNNYEPNSHPTLLKQAELQRDSQAVSVPKDIEGAALTRAIKNASVDYVAGVREKIVTVTSRLKKLIMLARQGRVSCPCGHVCGGAKGKRLAFGYGPREECLLSGDKLAAKVPVGRSEETVLTREVFRAPYRLPSMPPTMPNSATVSPNMDKLPRWTNRRRQARKTGYQVTRLMALAPAPTPTPAPAPVLRVLPGPRPHTLVRLLPATDRPIAVPVQASAWSLAQPKDSLTLNRVGDKIFQSELESKLISQQAQVAEVEQVVAPPRIEVTPCDRDNKVTVYAAPSDSQSRWETVNVNCDSKEDCTPNLANLLDISLPSNMGDDHSGGKKEDHFAGLLHTESMSIPSMSPSHLLRDDQWLDSEVQNFSLSSFLGHLEAAPPPRTADPAQPSGDTVDTQLQCLMGETSIDYMAKFEDLARAAEATK